MPQNRKRGAKTKTKPKGGGHYTIKRGKVKVTSEKQRRFLEAKGLPFSHVTKTKSGKKKIKRHNA